MQVQTGPQEQFWHFVMMILLLKNAVKRHLLLKTHDLPRHYTLPSGGISVGRFLIASARGTQIVPRGTISWRSGVWQFVKKNSCKLLILKQIKLP